MKYKSYSITEIIVVVAIISLLSAVLVPLLGMYAPQTRLAGDAKVLMAALRKVQQWSITGQRRYGIELYPDEQRYTLFRRDYDEITGGIIITEIETVDLSTGIEINEIFFDDEAPVPTPEGYIRIQFDSFGAPRNADDDHIHAEIVLINQRNDILTIDVRRNTGHVRILSN